mmetsp:Transcript_11558/g.53774  ORF Transcript_11558/g.53774 Transcript_11558/m.53774 type:complete len:224 (+) Transcript_11558:89-760(+)
MLSSRTHSRVNVHGRIDGILEQRVGSLHLEPSRCGGGRGWRLTVFFILLLASDDDEGGRDGRLHHGLNHRLRRGHSLPRRTRRLVESGNLRRRRRERRRVVNRGQHTATRAALPPAHTQARHRSRGSRRGLRRSRRSLRGVPQAALTPRHDPVHQPADTQQPPANRTRGDAIDGVFNHPRLGQTRTRSDVRDGHPWAQRTPRVGPGCHRERDVDLPFHGKVRE